MWVIKLGGSLEHVPLLRAWLHAIAAGGQGRAVIVPGGGSFAEQVRRAQQVWHFDDGSAHRMAILAMQQMALMFQALQSDIVVASTAASVRNYLKQKQSVLWSPAIAELDAAGIPTSWDVSSDSLAAWLAHELSATHLILVKSAPLSRSWTLAELGERGIVDSAFGHFSEKLDCLIEVFNRDELSGFKNYLRSLV